MRKDFKNYRLGPLAWALIGLCLTLLSCRQSISNDFDTQVKDCGRSAKPGFTFYQPTDLDLPIQSAVAVADLTVTPFAIEGDGCIEINNDFEGMIAIRSESGGRLLQWSEASLGLSPSSDSSFLDNIQTTLNCTDTTIFASDRIRPRLERQASSLVQFNQFYLEVFKDDQLILNRNIPRPSAEIRVDDLALNDGQYQLVMRSFDAFGKVTGAPDRISKCGLVVDRVPPMVRSNLENIDYYDLKRQLRKLPQSTTIAFDIEDENGSSLFLCQKKRDSEFSEALDCTKNEYFENQSFLSAPSEGVWDIAFFARDRAGNESEIVKESFVVYHDRDIEALQAKLLLAENFANDGLTTQSIPLLEQALASFQELELVDERKEIIDHLIQASWTLNQISLRYELDLPESPRKILLSPNGERLILLSLTGQLYELTAREIFPRENGVLLVAFDRRNRLWWVSDDGAVQSELEGLAVTVGTLNSEMIPDLYDFRASLTVDDLGEAAAVVGREESQVFQFLNGLWSSTIVRNFPKEATEAKTAQWRFSQDRRYLLFKGPSEIQWIDRLSGEVSFSFKSPEACKVTSISPGEEAALFFTLASEKASEAEKPCAGVYFWNPSKDLEAYALNQDLRLTEFANESLVRTLSSGESWRILVAADRADAFLMAERQPVEPEDGAPVQLGKLTRVKSETSQNIVSHQVSIAEDYLALATAQGIELRSLMGDTSVNDTLRRFPIMKSFQYRLSSEDLWQIGDSRALVYATEDSLFGTKYVDAGIKDRKDLDKNLNDALTGNREYIFSSLDDGSLTVMYDVKTGELEFFDEFLEVQQRLPLDFFPTALDLNPDGLYLGDADGNLYQWKLKSTEAPTQIHQFSDPIIGILKAEKVGAIVVEMPEGRSTRLEVFDFQESLGENRGRLGDVYDQDYIWTKDRRYLITTPLNFEDFSRSIEIFDVNLAASVYSKKLSSRTIEPHYDSVRHQVYWPDDGKLHIVDFNKASPQSLSQELDVNFVPESVRLDSTRDVMLLRSKKPQKLYLRTEDGIKELGQVKRLAGFDDDFGFLGDRIFFNDHESKEFVLAKTDDPDSSLRSPSGISLVKFFANRQTMLLYFAQINSASDKRLLKRLSYDPLEIEKALQAW